MTKIANRVTIRRHLRPHVFEVYDPCHGTHLYLIINASASQLEKLLLKLLPTRKKFVADPGDGGSVLSWKGENGVHRYVIYLEKYQGDALAISEMAHEIFHFCMIRLKHLGIRYMTSQEDVHAYYLEKITYNIHTLLKDIKPQVRTR